MVKCSICLCISTKGPIASRPKGHLVCRLCNQQMIAELPHLYKSPWDLNLTAKMLIESMEHMCTNQGCKKTLSHQDLTKHKEELCKFRMVRCPGRDPECKVELPICTLNNQIQNCKTTTPAKFVSILQRSLLMVIA